MTSLIPMKAAAITIAMVMSPPLRPLPGSPKQRPENIARPAIARAAWIKIEVIVLAPSRSLPLSIILDEAILHKVTQTSDAKRPERLKAPRRRHRQRRHDCQCPRIRLAG